MIRGLVYFMKPVGMAGPIKIGCSAVPADRLLSLSVWSPFPLELLAYTPGDERLEANIQDCFADQHLRREWFEPDPLLMAGIAALVAGAPVERAFDLSAKRGSVRKQRRGKYNGWSELARQRASFSHRLRCAATRLKNKTGAQYLSPSDVAEMFYGRCRPLSVSQIARIEEVLADPEKHFRSLNRRSAPIQQQAVSA